MIFTLDNYSIDTDAYEVRRGGELVAVEPQVFDLLVVLLENRDRVVTKDEIIDRVWNGRIVSDTALSSRIKAARQALGDDGTSQKYIRTVRRRGFRLVADVTQSGGQANGETELRPASANKTEGPAPNSEDRTALVGTGTAGRRRIAVLGAVGVAILIGLTAAWQLGRPGQKPPIPITEAALGMPMGPGIAVLRFRNLSGESGMDFFSDAVTEEIITGLTRFSELRIAARAETSEYDQQQIDPKEIGQRLGVMFLLQGSLRRSGSRVRLTAKLLKVQDGTLVWADSYERHVTPADILSVQAEIARQVVAAIASISTGVIARETRDYAQGKLPHDLNAYECTSRTNDIMTMGFSAASHLAARNCLEAAVQSEPDYAAAWAMLAWTHSIEYTQSFNKRPDSHPLQRALAAARRAVDLAPANPMAHFAMARASYLLGDLDTFYAEAALALKLNPHEPLLLGNLGNWLAFSGRWAEGVALVRKAIALNPKIYPRWWHAAIAKNYYRKGEYREALAEFKKINLPNWFWSQVELAYTYGQLGDLKNARKAKEKLLELYPGFNLETAAMEHRKFSFEQSYIDLAIDGLKKAGLR